MSGVVPDRVWRSFDRWLLPKKQMLRLMSCRLPHQIQPLWLLADVTFCLPKHTWCTERFLVTFYGFSSISPNCSLVNKPRYPASEVICLPETAMAFLSPFCSLPQSGRLDHTSCSRQHSRRGIESNLILENVQVVFNNQTSPIIRCMHLG